MANVVASQAGRVWSASLDMTNAKWPIALDMANVLTESVFVPEDTQDTHANKVSKQLIYTLPLRPSLGLLQCYLLKREMEPKVQSVKRVQVLD